MSEVSNETKTVMSDVSTIEKKIESIIFNVLKNKIRAHIYVKMEDKTSETAINTLHINITSYGVVYDEELKLPDNVFEMISQNEGYGRTLGLMVLDNFKKYIDTIFFIQDSKPYKKFVKKSREN